MQIATKHKKDKVTGNRFTVNKLILSVFEPTNYSLVLAVSEMRLSVRISCSFRMGLRKCRCSRTDYYTGYSKTIISTHH